MTSQSRASGEKPRVAKLKLAKLKIAKQKKAKLQLAKRITTKACKRGVSAESHLRRAFQKQVCAIDWIRELPGAC